MVRILCWPESQCVALAGTELRDQPTQDSEYLSKR